MKTTIYNNEPQRGTGINIEIGNSQFRATTQQLALWVGSTIVFNIQFRLLSQMR